jgi:hypothetical protein
MFERLVYGPFGQLEQLEQSREVPACIRLLAGTLIRDIEAGRLDTLAGILDAFSVKQESN